MSARSGSPNPVRLDLRATPSGKDADPARRRPRWTLCSARARRPTERASDDRRARPAAVRLLDARWTRTRLPSGPPATGRKRDEPRPTPRSRLCTRWRRTLPSEPRLSTPSSPRSPSARRTRTRSARARWTTARGARPRRWNAGAITSRDWWRMSSGVCAAPRTRASTMDPRRFGFAKRRRARVTRATLSRATRRSRTRHRRSPKMKRRRRRRRRRRISCRKTKTAPRA